MFVPELSRFFGIIIRMFLKRACRITFLVSMRTLSTKLPFFRSVIDGTLSPRQRRLFEAWGELRQDELLADWQLLHSGRAAAPIEPSK